jgi:hypothetical protein
MNPSFVVRVENPTEQLSFDTKATADVLNKACTPDPSTFESREGIPFAEL